MDGRGIKKKKREKKTEDSASQTVREDTSQMVRVPVEEQPEDPSKLVRVPVEQQPEDPSQLVRVPVEEQFEDPHVVVSLDEHSEGPSQMVPVSLDEPSEDPSQLVLVRREEQPEDPSVKKSEEICLEDAVGGGSGKADAGEEVTAGRKIQGRIGRDVEGLAGTYTGGSGEEMQTGTGRKMQEYKIPGRSGTSGKEMQTGTGRQMRGEKIHGRSGTSEKEMQTGTGRKMQGESGAEDTYESGEKQSEDAGGDLSGKADTGEDIKMKSRPWGIGLVDALCGYREILRTEVLFLRTEVKSRDLASLAGRRAYRKSQSNSKDPQLIQQKSGSSVENMNWTEVNVSLPYLVRDHNESLDLLLHEMLVLRYRVQSLVSIMQEFSVPISCKKVEKLLTMSGALASISQHIKRSDMAKSRKQERSDVAKSCKQENPMSSYDRHYIGWLSTKGSGSPNCGFFNDTTTLSPMHFTSCPPSVFPYTATSGPALHIYSIEIADLNPNLEWPLYIYGVVAARDTVDHNRNLLFSRSRANCQKLTLDDPFLHLTGPSRAIVAVEPVMFEVELKIKYGAGFRDTAVLSCEYSHCYAYDETPEIGSGCFTAKLRLRKLARSVQATIVSVHVIGGVHCFEHGGKVFCSSDAARRDFVLLDCRGRKMPSGLYGSICLSRNVVSVELHGTLKVSIAAYSKSGVCCESYIEFPVKPCQTSEDECFVGNSKVKVVVAWSLLAMDKEDLMMQGYMPR